MSMFCWIIGHTFKPRYSEKLPKGLTFKGNNPEKLAAQIQAAKLKVYEGDVCEACGLPANTPMRSFAGTEWSWSKFPDFSEWPGTPEELEEAHKELEKMKEELKKLQESLKAK